VRTSRFTRLTSTWFVLGVVAALTLTSVSSSAAQFGAIRDAARRAAEEAKKKAEDAKKPADDPAKKDQPTAPATATPPAATAAAPAAAATPAAAPAFEVYGKYDFVPGEKIVAADDFTQDAIGDFPGRWNTNAAGEIVTIAGQTGRWLKLTRAGFFTPEFVTDLPDNVTVEFDLAVPPTADPGIALTTALVQLNDMKQPQDWQTAPNSVQINAHPSASAAGTSSMVTRQDGTSAPGNTTTTAQLTGTKGRPVHVALWRQRQRVRVYMNQEKVWDIPRAVAASAKLNSIVFFVGGGCGNCEYYLANLRVATGAPDTRNKVISEGKWVSHGILFDVNSDRLKGESYGSLKEIASVLTETPDLKVQIVGHTDADGDDAANMDLSKRRAASVKAALVSEFKIDAARLDTDGKGETQPIDKNDTPAGKANNRRVEFIKK
jgi:outer membrane protein OmpA-like peptidoglycan-associated protein